MDKHKNYNIQIIINLSIIAFSVVAGLEYNLNKYSESGLPTQYSTFVIVAILTLASVYILCIIDDKLQKSNSKKLRVFNLLFLIAICITVVLFTGGPLSRYKYLFILLVISSTIEGDKVYGITVSIISSMFLIVIDLISRIGIGFSEHSADQNYLENDLVLCCIFFVISYAISYCISDKKEHINTLQSQITKDELTKLNNYRSFEEQLRHCFKQSKEKEENLSLALMDLDWFKDYNDIYGHNKGNGLLKTVGELMLHMFPDNFILSRYGGDEFVIIMPDTDIDTAFSYANNFRVYFANYPFEGNNYLPHGRLSVSIGVASMTSDMNDASKLINNADEALYRAKFTRRNSCEKYISFADEFSIIIKGFNSELEASVNTLFAVISSKEKYTSNHCMRVYYICEGFSDYLNLESNDRKTLLTAAYLHDIGKININKETLLKSNKLTDEEFEEIKTHPVVGEKLLLSSKGLEKESKIVRQHHERYDGRGYPDKLSGNNILYLARILSIADSYDAMTNQRPYKLPKSVNEAKDEIMKCAGSQFDPDLAKKFVEYLSYVN